MDVASSVAQRMGFPEARVEDIRTAVSEATVNAIEHGNAGDPSRVVVVVLTPTPTLLEIRVRDGAVAPLRLEEEVGGPESARPDLEAMLAGEAAARGWGVFLIRSLVDEAEFSTTGLGNLVRMVVHLNEPGGAGGG
jgi:serine/threonine-protein kinase RsbW